MDRMRCVAVGSLLTVLVLAAGCSTLPTSGEVTTEPGTPASGTDQAPYFVPPGPAAGADRESIVRGFLLATQANPPSTSVARSFLSQAARSTWKPAGAIVYESSNIETESATIVAHLTEANRIDRRGTWTAAERPASVDLDLQLVLENGEWRIENPPASLPVPASYFRNTYLPYLLYFFDRSATVLVPSRVYLPRGEQVASSLVRGLLAGPTGVQAEATVTAFASDIDLDLSVVVGSDGIAEVPLSSDVLQLPRDELYRIAVQLSATLGQLPGVLKFRVTVGGVAIPLVNGQTDIGLDLAPEFDPVTAPSTDVVAIADGRVVLKDDAGTQVIGGPLGEEGFALRSIAVSARTDLAAAVARNGHRVYVAPTKGDRDPRRVRTVLDGASNLLRPSYDRFGNLWLVDAARSGAVVHLLSEGSDRIVEIPGISGEQLSSFTVTRDGASFVAGLATGSTPSILVSSLVRSAAGRVADALAARRVPIPDADLESVIDVAQGSATGVTVLTSSTSRGGRLRSVEIDGSPGLAFAANVFVLPDVPVSVLARPDGQEPALVVTADRKLLGVSGPQGAWITLLTGVLAATYPQ